MVKWHSDLGARSIRFELPWSYAVLMSSDGTVTVLSGRQPVLTRIEFLWAVEIVLNDTEPDPRMLRDAILILRRGGMNIAFAPDLVNRAGEEGLIEEWINHLPEMFREDARLAHNRLNERLDGYGQPTVGQLAPLAKGV